MNKGIIFDVDGTLWDSSASVAEAWNAYLQKHTEYTHIRLTGDGIRRSMGLSLPEVADTVFSFAGIQERKALLEGCLACELSYLEAYGAVLYPGMADALRSLGRRYPLYIVSNCQDGYIELFLKVSGVKECIRDFESYGHTGLQKSANIRLLMERNGMDDAVYVGDTQGDYESAQRAGISFVYAAYGFGRVQGDVPGISSIRELENKLAELGF